MLRARLPSWSLLCVPINRRRDDTLLAAKWRKGKVGSLSSVAIGNSTLFEGFQEVPVFLCALFLFLVLFRNLLLLSSVLLLAPRPLYLVAFFCHHRAYNSHFMSPLPLTLFFCAAVVWELRTQRYEFTNFMTPFFTHSPTDETDAVCSSRSLLRFSSVRAGVVDNVKLKSTLEWKMEWKIRRRLTSFGQMTIEDFLSFCIWSC